MTLYGTRTLLQYKKERRAKRKESEEKVFV